MSVCMYVPVHAEGGIAEPGMIVTMSLCFKYYSVVFYIAYNNGVQNFYQAPDPPP